MNVKGIMMHSSDRRQSRGDGSGVTERFSLAPAEGERAGVRGQGCAAWLRIVLCLALFIATVPAPAATNVWSGLGTDNTWINPGNWFGTYGAANTNQFTNVTTTINFSVNTNTAGILLNGPASNVTITNAATTMTLTGGYGLNIQTGSLTLNLRTNTLGAAQTWTVASGAALTINSNVNKAAFLLTISNDGTAAIGGIISGTAGLTKSGIGTLTLSGTNSYSGNTIINGGTLTVSGSINGGGTVRIASGATFDAEADNVTTTKNWTNSGTVNCGNGFYQTLGSLTLNSGTLTGTGTDDPQFGFYTISSPRTVTATGGSQISAPGHLSFTGAANVTFNVVNAVDTLTITSPITNAASTAGLTKTGAGVLTLAGTNNYVGPTTISAGTLALGPSGSLAAVSSISLAAGATLDVSGLGAAATYTLGSGATLTASGTGTVVGTSAAAIRGDVTGTISLGSQPITLTYNGTQPALYVPQGTLALNGNAITVNSAAPLAPGTYPIIQQASGSISTNGTITVTGTAISPAMIASLQVVGGNLNLVLIVRPPYLNFSSVNGGVNPTAGTPFNVVVQVLFGNATPTNVVANTTVTLSLASGTGTLGGTLTGTILVGTGSVTFSGITYNRAEGGVILTATQTSGDVLPATNSPAFTVNPGAAAILTLTSGDGQSGRPTLPLASPFVVTVTDANTNLISGFGVAFAIASVPAGAAGQSLSVSNTTTSVSGQASTLLTLGDTPGNYIVTATSGTLSGSPVTFTATVPAPGTNIWSGAGIDNTWTNLGNWYGSYTPDNINQFTNGTTNINFSTSTSTAGILISDTATNVTVTNTANTMTLTGRYGVNVTTGALNLNLGAISLAAAQTWSVASGATLTVTSNVNKTAYLLTLTNDGVAAINGIISGTDGLTKSGAGVLTLGGLSTYTGNTIVNTGTLRVSGTINGGGTVTVGSGATLDAQRINVTSGKAWNISGTVSAGSGFYQTLGNLTLASGTLTGTGTGNAQFGFYTITAPNSVTATGSSQIIAPGRFTFQGTGSVTCNVVNVGDALTISSVVSNAASTAGLTKTGSGLLTLNATNAYVGPTTISAGTLALGATGLLAAASSVNIAAGATFDVSGRGASATYTLGTGATLTANGVGTVVGTSAATIRGGITGTVSLGARPISLTCDGVNPALYISQGTLVLNGNAFTVNAAAPLPIGTYPLIQQASGNVTSNGTFTVTGTAIGAVGTVASIQVVGGTVNLVISVRPPYLTISSVNGGVNPSAGVGFNVVVQVLFGNAVPTNVIANSTVTLSRATGTGALGGNVGGTLLAGSNSVTISGVTYTKAESGVVLTATRTTGDIMPAGNSAAFTVTAGPAAIITMTSGNNQTGNRWAALESPFVVTVTDAFTNVVSGTNVTFAIGTVPAGATLQTLSPTNATTTTNGQASTVLTIGSVVGTYTVTASSASLRGSPVTFSAAANAPDYTPVSAVTFEYQICFKCHSGYSWLPASPPKGLSPNGSVVTPLQTDCAQEFSPANRSGHPVVTGLNNYSNSLTPRALTAAAMRPPWNVNLGTQTMLCTDCHDATTTNFVAGAAQGPHGSANQYMLRGPNAANWPNVTLANINTSWCMNCHNNAAGVGHTEGNHSGLQCYVCHLVVQHGGKVSRMMTDHDNMPPRYAYSNTRDTNNLQGFTKSAINDYNESSCRAQCHGEGPHQNRTPDENW